MAARPLLMTGLLGAAVAGPIAVTEGPKHFDSFGFGQAQSTNPGATPHGSSLGPPTIASPEGPGALIYESPAPIEGFQFASLAEMLNMDVSKEWVYARWARKSTGLADPELFGVRVPVVTGTAMTDVAGSLSYYFNAAGRVDRLRFHGRTADTTALVAIAQQRYGMTPQPTMAGEQLLQAREGRDKVVSEMRTRPEPVLWSTSPHDSFTVDLEINRPGTGRYVAQRRLIPELPPAAEAPPPETEAAVAESVAAPAAEAESAAAEVSRPRLQDAKRPTFRWPN